MRAQFSLRHFRHDNSPPSAQREFLTQRLQGVVFENTPGKRGSLGLQAASCQALVPCGHHAAVPGSADSMGRSPPKKRPGEAWAPRAGEPPAAPVTCPLSPPQRLHHRAGLSVHCGHRLQRRAARQHHALQGRPAPARPARSPGAEGSSGHGGVSRGRLPPQTAPPGPSRRQRFGSPPVPQTWPLHAFPAGARSPSTCPGSLIVSTVGFALRLCVHEPCL